jgi:hypothetical protein
VVLAERFRGMLPWEARARTLGASVDDVEPILELLGHEADVSHNTVDVGPDDFFEDEYDPTCAVCRRFS